MRPTAAAAWLAPLLPRPGGAGAAAPRCADGRACPHIFVVVVDDGGWDNVGWHNVEMLTPHTDALLGDGIELDRHYTFMYCAPTRSALMTGRLPHHVNQVCDLPMKPEAGVPLGMTMLPAKLKRNGYATRAVGKWHLGFSSPARAPAGRGLDAWLGYHCGAEDHFTQKNCDDHLLCNEANNKTLALHDLWDGDGPARSLAGTQYSGYLFTERVVADVAAHDPATPLFYYVAFATAHEPLQVPREYEAKYPESWRRERRVYAGMTSFWDEAVGNVTAALRARAMWADTLVVLTSDNGGPDYPSLGNVTGCGGASNYPLRGGKSTNWEGGVRVFAGVGGGFLPAKVRGTKQAGYIHVADWYATLCSLAGVPAADPHDGLPDVDSIDMWPLLSGAAASSPRGEIVLSVDSPQGADMNRDTDPATVCPGLTPSCPFGGNVSAMIQGDYKLLLGNYFNSFWQGPGSPNASSCCTNACWARHIVACGGWGGGGCVFNIKEDPNETHDLAVERPDLLARLRARLAEHRATLWQPDRSEVDTDAAVAAWVLRYRGFVGPWLP